MSDTVKTAILTLIDLSFAGNLLIIVIFSGYENFVSKININNHEEFEIHSIEKTLKNCDLFVFLVAHDEFKNIDLDNLNILDFCNIKTT